LVVSLDSVDEHEQAISEDARCTLLMHGTVRIRRKPWNSPHAIVRTRNAPITATVAVALIWSVVEPIAVFLACCAPCVRARFRCARVALATSDSPGFSGRITNH
jgi:hypothetical protein